MSVHCDHQDEVVPRQSNYVGLIAELRRNLPILSILDQMEDVKPYECDGLSAYRQVPRAVILPRLFYKKTYNCSVVWCTFFEFPFKLSVCF